MGSAEREPGDPVSAPIGLPSPRDLGFVAVGGAAGSLLRYGAGLALPGPAGTFAVNVVGAFLLGVLLEWLVIQTQRTRISAERGARLRLLLGTGVLGGFTTYSLLAADVAEMLIRGSVLQGVWYGLGSVLLGAVSAALGIAVARMFLRSKRPGEGDA